MKEATLSERVQRVLTEDHVQSADSIWMMRRAAKAILIIMDRARCV